MDSLQLVNMYNMCISQCQVQLVIMIYLLLIDDSQIIITITMQIEGDQAGDEPHEEWPLREVFPTEEYIVELHQV